LTGLRIVADLSFTSTISNWLCGKATAMNFEISSLDATLFPCEA